MTDEPDDSALLPVAPFAPGWGLTPAEWAANHADWVRDVEMRVGGEWPTSEEIAEFETSLKLRRVG